MSCLFLAGRGKNDVRHAETRRKKRAHGKIWRTAIASPREKTGFNKNTRKTETQSSAAVLRPDHDNKRHADIFELTTPMEQKVLSTRSGENDEKKTREKRKSDDLSDLLYFETDQSCLCMCATVCVCLARA
jgi:hypothetical protein